MYMLSFFFVKQKTAYELRISDWSSDVCSSDLARPHPKRQRTALCRQQNRQSEKIPSSFPPEHIFHTPLGYHVAEIQSHGSYVDEWPNLFRSEEHTSELQSLMRISYAVFCLKKKNLTNKLKYLINSQ